MFAGTSYSKDLTTSFLAGNFLGVSVIGFETCFLNTICLFELIYLGADSAFLDLLILVILFKLIGFSEGLYSELYMFKVWCYSESDY